MTLKKDALVCVSLAGVVLLMAAFSNRGGRAAPEEAELASGVSLPHRDLLSLYIDSLNGQHRSSRDRANWNYEARQKVLRWYKNQEFRQALDLFRAAAILQTSTESSELALAHELSVQALARGVQPARKLVFASEDRLLLSTGQDQRYGTQADWDGQVRPDYQRPSVDITPTLGKQLGIEVPKTRMNYP